MITNVLYLVVAYFLGNILGARVLKLIYGNDITEEGSKNPGARNAGRVLGSKAFVLVATIDLFKGYFAVILLKFFNVDNIIITAAAALVVLGHIKPILFRFQGGKGVATFIGTVLAISPNLIFILILAVALIALFTRSLTVAFYSSLPFLLMTYIIETRNVGAGVLYALMVLFLIFIARRDIKNSFEKYFSLKRSS